VKFVLSNVECADHHSRKRISIPSGRSASRDCDKRQPHSLADDSDRARLWQQLEMLDGLVENTKLS
jgi:hypothetical protein